MTVQAVTPPKPTIGARVTDEFNTVVLAATKAMGFKTKSDLIETAVREYLERNGFSIKGAVVEVTN